MGGLTAARQGESHATNAGTGSTGRPAARQTSTRSVEERLKGDPELKRRVRRNAPNNAEASRREEPCDTQADTLYRRSGSQQQRECQLRWRDRCFGSTPQGGSTV